MRWPDRRLVGGALAAGILGAVGVVLLQAPVPAVSGPNAAALTGPESAPHSHVAVGPSTGPVPVGGTAASARGYTLVVTGRDPFTFHIQGPDGHPATRFAMEREKRLHLIAVRHDLSGFQHVHPSMAPDGTWTVPLTLTGGYRVYADFAALDGSGRQNLVLGTDISAGDGPPVPLPAPSTVDTVDGLTVSYAGSLTAGVVEPLLFRVTRSGAPVAVQPYLGAYGHLVMLRQADLGYLHVHPEPGLAEGAAKFWVVAPSTGTFRMYLDFQVDGTVHTAQFTVLVS
jgi:hypothetical protein